MYQPTASDWFDMALAQLPPVLGGLCVGVAFHSGDESVAVRLALGSIGILLVMCGRLLQKTLKG